MAEKETNAARPDGTPNDIGIVRRGTGPRTAQGKERSKRNAIKHGIFSSVALLKSESRGEFDFLLNGLRTNLRPEGMLEEILIEKLTLLIWRHRRLVIAEVAEIRKRAEFLGQDENTRQEEEARDIVESWNAQKNDEPFADVGSGLIRHISNRLILQRCLTFLRELYQNIEEDGFNLDRDHAILGKLYGADEHLLATVKDEYEIWSATAECPEEERNQHGYAAPSDCIKNVLEAIAVEIKRLTSYDRTRQKVDAVKIDLDRLRASVPYLPEFDRLARYEAGIERAFDRTLTQLERLQRSRLGQPTLPPLKVDVST